MNKKEVIERFCKLATKVAHERFQHRLASDCFCSFNLGIVGDSFQFDPTIIEFIENAVEGKLK